MLCLDVWTTRWVKKWLAGQAQRVVVSKSYATWMPVTIWVTLISSAGQRIYFPLSTAVAVHKVVPGVSGILEFLWERTRWNYCRVRNAVVELRLNSEDCKSVLFSWGFQQLCANDLISFHSHERKLKPGNLKVR